MKRRGLAALLACVLLAGCGSHQVETPLEETPVNGPVIAYVPLDDRPDNAERVVYLANSLNYRLAMPEEETLAIGKIERICSGGDSVFQYTNPKTGKAWKQSGSRSAGRWRPQW